jgi:hypothetical protein
MGAREDFGNFDLGRLTLVGWLVFLVSFGVGIGAAIVVGTYWDSMFPPPPGRTPPRFGPAGVAGFAAGVAFFFAAKVLLNLAGVTLMRPKPDEPTTEDFQDEAEGGQS